MRTHFLVFLAVLLLGLMLTSCDEDTVTGNEDDPTADFTFTFVTDSIAPAEVQFNNQSVQADEFDWDFGDGNSSSMENPTHTYDQPGSYDVTLIVVNGISPNSDMVTKTIEVVAPVEPVANFTYTFDGDSKAPATVDFQNTSLNADVYAWDFGNGQTSAEENPTVVYDMAGTFTVELTATDTDAQLSDTYSMDITIDPPDPIADFSFSGNQQMYSEITFTNESQHADTYHWDFGDGDTSTDENPTNTYTTAGTFTIQLIASYSATDMADTVEKDITITIPDPEAAFDISGGTMTPATITMTNNSLYSSSYHWDFGNGEESTDTNPSVIYDAQGTYTITLTATQDQSGKTDTATREVTITPGSVEFSAWSIVDMPFVDENGDEWDTTDDPDLYTIIRDQNGVILNNEDTDTRGDIGSEDLPVRWNFNSPLAIANWDNEYTIEIWDSDTFGGDDQIKTVSFTINAIISNGDYPATVSIKSADQVADIHIELIWE